jgi:hypothetical protein
MLESIAIVRSYFAGVVPVMRWSSASQVGTSTFNWVSRVKSTPRRKPLTMKSSATATVIERVTLVQPRSHDAGNRVAEDHVREAAEHRSPRAGSTTGVDGGEPEDAGHHRVEEPRRCGAEHRTRDGLQTVGDGGRGRIEEGHQHRADDRPEPRHASRVVQRLVEVLVAPQGERGRPVRDDAVVDVSREGARAHDRRPRVEEKPETERAMGDRIVLARVQLAERAEGSCALHLRGVEHAGDARSGTEAAEGPDDDRIHDDDEPVAHARIPSLPPRIIGAGGGAG